MTPEEWYELQRLLSLYANHAQACGCFICRHLTDPQRDRLTAFWDAWGGRKARTKNPYSPQHKRPFERARAA